MSRRKKRKQKSKKPASQPGAGSSVSTVTQTAPIEGANPLFSSNTTENPDEAGHSRLKEKLHEIIFEADTPAGKFFDVILLLLIAASILCVLLESVDSINKQYQAWFAVLEWAFTIFFTAEYLLRIYCVLRPSRYIFSFYGIIDLLAILPTYLGLFITNSSSLLVIRALRMMRVFRVFKLGHFTNEGALLVKALKASRAKITVFVFFVMVMVVIIGSLMYLIEGGIKGTGFTNIPRSMYWTIVTLTTVGYGDISPQTAFGQFLASVVMLIGYAVIAVPTGLVSAELIQEANAASKRNTQSCRHCSAEGHDDDAIHCKYCGEKLNI